MIEIFVVNQEIQQIFAFNLIENHLLPVTHVVRVDYLLYLIESSQSTLEVAIDDKIDYQF